MLAEAIKATFDRRKTLIPSATPVALTEAFGHDADKQKQWRAFGTRTGLDDWEDDLSMVISRLRRFLAPPLTAIRDNESFPREWPAGGPWT